MRLITIACLCVLGCVLGGQGLAAQEAAGVASHAPLAPKHHRRHRRHHHPARHPAHHAFHAVHEQPATHVRL
jgi:hypothetical protein